MCFWDMIKMNWKEKKIFKKFNGNKDMKNKTIGGNERKLHVLHKKGINKNLRVAPVE